MSENYICQSSSHDASELPSIYTRYGEVSADRYRHFLAAATMANMILGKPGFVKIVDLSEDAELHRTQLPTIPTAIAIQGEWVQTGDLGPFWRAVEISETVERSIESRIRAE